MKTKSIIKEVKSNTIVNPEVSGYKKIHKGNNTLLGFKLKAFGYLSPSAVHDHLTGTQIILDKEPTKDLIIEVEHRTNGITYKESKRLPATKWQPIYSDHNPSLVAFRFVDGTQNQDWFHMDNIYNGTPVFIKLIEEVPVEAILWEDDDTWNDSLTWREEYIEAVWNDDMLWSDLDFWMEAV